MKRSSLSTAISVVCLSLSATCAIAAPWHDPTFEANAKPPFSTAYPSSQLIRQASDGGYFYVGGLSVSGHEASLPCQPTRATVPVPGNEGFYVTNHYLYQLIKLNEQGQMDCSFNLWTWNSKATGGVFPDGEGKLYVTGDAHINIYDRFGYSGGVGSSSYSIARFDEGHGGLDGIIKMELPNVIGEYIGSFKPSSGFLVHQNRIGTVAIDKTADTPFSPKLIVGGAYQDSRESDFKNIWRLNGDGSEDSGFYTMRVNASSGSTGIRKIVLLPSGKILVGGKFAQADDDPFYKGFIRLNADGTLDRGFQVAMVEGSTYSGFIPNRMGGIYDFAVQPDGKIIVAGHFSKANNIGEYDNLVRLNPDGSIDDSFTPPKFINNRYGTPINSVALQSDGKIIVAATSKYDPATGQSALMRLNADGTLDNTFRIQFTARTGSTHVYSANFDRQCRLMVAFQTSSDEPPENVFLPLTGETVSAPYGVMRLTLEDGTGCTH